jgi:hypothetical protein
VHMPTFANSRAEPNWSYQEIPNDVVASDDTEAMLMAGELLAPNINPASCPAGLSRCCQHFLRRGCQLAVDFTSASAHLLARSRLGSSVAGMVAQPLLMTKSRCS